MKFSLVSRSQPNHIIGQGLQLCLNNHQLSRVGFERVDEVGIEMDEEAMFDVDLVRPIQQPQDIFESYMIIEFVAFHLDDGQKFLDRSLEL